LGAWAKVTNGMAARMKITRRHLALDIIS